MSSSSSIKGARQISLALRVVLGTAAMWWFLFWFLTPITTAKEWFKEIDQKVTTTFLGARGSVFLLQVLPPAVIAFLSFFVIGLRRRTAASKKSSNESGKPKVGIWNLPLVVKSPLGMLTLVDVIVIGVTLFVTLWYFIKIVVDRAELIDNTKQSPGKPSRALQKLDAIGVYLGKSSLIPFALLWIPVSRGSPFLRITGIPFESAVKYHTWLGLLTIWILVFHGISYLAYFPLANDAAELIHWQTRGVALLPGIIALMVGLIMLFTALNWVRRNSFNFFFLAHHLYIAFLVFFGFHCVSQMPYVITPVLLFFLDRFIRMLQSRKSVDVLSTKILASGVMELKFAIPESMTYYPLSFMYMLVPTISRWEWHPFSVASTPLDETNQICIYVKPLGGYTKDIHDALIDTKRHKEIGKLKCPFGFKLSLEGPYGDESNFYLQYRSLVLVAGGIGVTPHFAILRDILHRHRMEEENVPESVMLILCVRDPKDLCILDTLNPNDILPSYKERVQIQVHVYITSKVPLDVSNAEMETGIGAAGIVSYEEYTNMQIPEAPQQYIGPPVEVVQGMSAVVGTGKSIWVAGTFLSTMAGYFVLWGVFNVAVIDTRTQNWENFLLYLVAIAVAVVVFGGGILALWTALLRVDSPKVNSRVLAESTTSLPPSPDKDEINCTSGDLEMLYTPRHSAWEGNVTTGSRPLWKETFVELAKHYQGRNVGVLVSGVPKMLEEVAVECKKHTLSRESNVAFHFHSVSFEL